MPANIGNNNRFISKGNMNIQTAPSSLPNLANTSETLEESVTALNKVLGLDPENAAARQALYETMQQLLRKDAFLAYQSETNIFYTIRTLDKFQFIHPKDRVVPEPFPPRDFVPAQAAITWLGWSLVGLIPAGLGTLACAPLAMIAAIKLLRQQVSLNDHRRAWIVLSAALVLWLISLVFISILVLHLG
jgi:hypothetical protein